MLKIQADRAAAASDWTGASFVPPAPRVKAVLSAIAGAIFALGVLRELLRLGFGIEGTSFINLNGEQNIGAWFSATMLAACAWLLLVSGKQGVARGRPCSRFWFVLAVTFVALSIDEASSIHEMLMEPIHETLHTHGIFRYAWVIPALIMVPTFAASSIPFLISLPRRTACCFVVSGAIYVSGALGMEMIGGLTDGHGRTFVLCYLIEETLEIVGILTFFFALMDHLGAGSTSCQSESSENEAI
jgi:hypothetical protein